MNYSRAFSAQHSKKSYIRSEYPNKLNKHFKTVRENQKTLKNQKTFI